MKIDQGGVVSWCHLRYVRVSDKRHVSGAREVRRRLLARDDFTCCSAGNMLVFERKGCGFYKDGADVVNSVIWLAAKLRRLPKARIWGPFPLTWAQLRVAQRLIPPL